MILITVAIVSLIFAKLLLKLSEGWARSSTCLLGKTAIVTGANRGVGFHTAQDFAKRGARVILACRDKTRADEAKEKIVEATGNPDVVVRIIDFASLTSVRHFAKEINETEARLDILVNNARVSHLKSDLSEDRLNLSMQINYFGPFLLTHLLIDLLKKSAPSRVVNLTSVCAWLAHVNPENLNGFPHTVCFYKGVSYGNIKLCNILFTNELARNLEGSGVVANSVNTGPVATETNKKLSWILKVLKKIASLLFKTSEQGAQTIIHVAVSKDLEKISGEYFDNCRTAWCPPMPKAARDETLAKKVWIASEEFVNLTSEELIRLPFLDHDNLNLNKIDAELVALF